MVDRMHDSGITAKTEECLVTTCYDMAIICDSIIMHVHVNIGMTTWCRQNKLGKKLGGKIEGH